MSKVKQTIMTKIILAAGIVRTIHMNDENKGNVSSTDGNGEKHLSVFIIIFSMGVLPIGDPVVYR